MGLREEKQERMRAQVVATALRLFREQGYDETTVEQIAQECWISPRTFYRHFESKDGVLAGMGSSLVRSAIEQIDRDPDLRTLTEALAAGIEGLASEPDGEQMLRLLREHPDLRVRAAVWRERWARDLAYWVAARADRDQPTFEEEVRCAVAVRLLGVAVGRWLKDGRTQPVAEVVAAAVDAIR